MNSLLAVQWPFSDSIVERIGWVLVHSVWQFVVLGLVAVIFLRLLRHRSSTARHGLLVFMLTAAVLAPVATWLLQPASLSQIREPVAADKRPGNDFASGATDFGNAVPKLLTPAAGMPESKPVASTTIVPPTAVTVSVREAHLSHTRTVVPLDRGGLVRGRVVVFTASADRLADAAPPAEDWNFRPFRRSAGCV